MFNFVFDNPVRVLFGPGQLKNLHEEKLPGKKALIATSNGSSTKKYGYLEAVEKELDAEPEMAAGRFDLAVADELADFCRKGGPVDIEVVGELLAREGDFKRIASSRLGPHFQIGEQFFRRRVLRQAVDLPREERVAVRKGLKKAADELDVGGAARGAGAEDLLAA